MERVCDKRSLIGFSCGHQFIITKRITFKVSLVEKFGIIFQ